MDIKFIPINFHDRNDCAILAKWFNDPEINYLISPNFTQGPLGYVSPEQIQQMNLYSRYDKYSYFIVCDNIIVGDINITDNPDFLLKKDGSSAWLGITIGEKTYRGKGVGKVAMHFIEDFAKEIGFKRIELGVFSFNTVAINFYKKLGYKQIGVIPRFTFYVDRWYDDFRFEKYI